MMPTSNTPPSNNISCLFLATIKLFCLCFPCIHGDDPSLHVSGDDQRLLWTPEENNGGNAMRFTVDNQSDPLFHPGFMDYCRLSENAFSGSEGSSVPGYHLKKVLILISPGQRATKIDFENMTSPDISCDFEHHANLASHRKVQSFPEVADIYRHMRSKKDGFKIFRPYPDSPFCEYEELSPLGTTQHILLGEYIGRKYSKFGFDEPYSVEGMLTAHCIQDEAAYQSIFAFLHGLLHEKDFVSTTVQKSLNNFCQIYPSHRCSCPKSDFLQHQIAKVVRRGFHIFKETAKIERSINEKISIPYHTDIAPREIVSFLSSWVCDRRQHPCKDGTCFNISISNLDDVFQSANDYLNHITSTTTFKSYAHLNVYPFFERLFKWLAGSGDERFSVMAAEEDFVVMVMTVLGLPVEQILPLASRLVFEIHESPQSKDLIVKIFLNGIDVSDRLAVSTDLNASMLGLEVVSEYYTRSLLSSFKDGDYYTECIS
ncbi:2-phosphoxylose phosphatase 1-like isoform X2 [Haliotis rufescens]|uniref:2-phosphoxylose phosphatase 1-like isoform X2 n=1 Tax=Haliotis rufescens TaxID=6454 RepID=UPI00201E8706|nr:2-phosphoxylose phosphatase 1-like isoform X2 [Haliotis rufescens]